MAVTPEVAAPNAASAPASHGATDVTGSPVASEGHATTEHKTEGLPQFDTTQWAGQSVWFLLIFGVVLLLMRFVFVPRIGGAIEARETKIRDDIEEARRLKDEADVQAAVASEETAKARSEAQRVGAEARAKAQAAIAAAMGVEEAKIAASMAESEAGISAAREAAMSNVQGIAQDTARLIVEKLTGRAATAQEVAAAAPGRA
jgi:F-type H+-transporting ATPase subunit b